jgi:hypothetical protein
MAESPLHRHEEWKAETAELHQLLATAQQRLSISPRAASPSVDGTPRGGASPDAAALSFSPAMDAPAVQPSFMSRLPEDRAVSAPGLAPASTLVEDMHSALALPELCDAVFVAKDGQEVHGIRAVMACRSAHFRKLLLDASSSGGAAAVIQMPDVSHAALSAVVTYLVTDELKVSAPEADGGAGGSEWATWVELVSLGAQWQLERMENLAVSRIRASIDEGNCIEILIESTHFMLEPLKKDCISYIVSHKEAVRQKRSWQELTKHPEILLAVSLAL